MTVDDAVIALEDLIADWRGMLQGSHRRPHRVSPGEIEDMARHMEALVFLIAEARKYEFLAATLAAAGGRPLEFVEQAGEDWS